MTGRVAPDTNPSPQAEPGKRRRTAVPLGIVVSAVLLIALHSRLDRQAVLADLKSANLWMLAAAAGMAVPINALIAIRFYWVAPSGSLPGYLEAVRLTLVTKAFNMFLPSKAGDLVKSYFVAKRGHVSAGVALSIVVYERLCDLFGLSSWCLLGWLVSPPPVAVLPSSSWTLLAAVAIPCLVLIASERSAERLVGLIHALLPWRNLERLRRLAEGWPDLHRAIRGRRRWIALVSMALWLANMTQLWMLTVALSAPVPFTEGLAIFAFAVIAGQLPLTFAGLGARDVALVVLLSQYMSAETAAAVGLLNALAGFIPVMVAGPLLRPYLAIAAGEAARWRQQRAS